MPKSPISLPLISSKRSCEKEPSSFMKSLSSDFRRQSTSHSFFSVVYLETAQVVNARIILLITLLKENLDFFVKRLLSNHF